MGKLMHGNISYSGNGYHVYSTTEQIVGEWVDGSPVYEKTFTGSLSTSPSDIVNLSTLNYDTIVKVEGMLINTVAGYDYKMSLNAYVNANNYSGVYITGEGVLKVFYVGVFQEYIVTVRYTKTIS